LLELFSSDEGLADATGEGNYSKVFTRTLDLGFTKLGAVSLVLVDWLGNSYGNDEIIFLSSFAHGEGETI
jgi:hypothetical protein